MEKKSGFYGGKFGVWLPVLFMLAGMLASTIVGGGGLARLTGITFFALALGFLLAKDKKNYGKITMKGLQNPILGTVIMAYLMAGILAQLLRQSGLIDALIWGITRLGLNAGWIPLVGFLACVLISTSCGTSTGSVTAVAPVLLPLAHSLGINMGLMCGAIISGAIFGDNLAPISDTTISSALTQEADISKVVRTRFPYAAISGAVAAGAFCGDRPNPGCQHSRRPGAGRQHCQVPGPAGRPYRPHGFPHAQGLGPDGHLDPVQSERHRSGSGSGLYRPGQNVRQ